MKAIIVGLLAGLTTWVTIPKGIMNPGMYFLGPIIVGAIYVVLSEHGDDPEVPQIAATIAYGCAIMAVSMVTIATLALATHIFTG